jgi:hypothetical protein
MFDIKSNLNFETGCCHSNKLERLKDFFSEIRNFKDNNVHQPMPVISDSLKQCFSNFFGSRHPSDLKKIGRHPCWVKMAICGTVCSKTLIKRH